MKPGAYKRGYCKALDDARQQLRRFGVSEDAVAALDDLDPRPRAAIHMARTGSLEAAKNGRAVCGRKATPPYKTLMTFRVTCAACRKIARLPTRETDP